MKRSNRLVLLIGILLAAVAFVAVIALFNQRQTPVATGPNLIPTVYAKVDIPLGTVITKDMVEARPLDSTIRPADAIGDPGLAIGKTVRSNVKEGAEVTTSTFSAGAGGGQDVAVLLDKGLRAIAVQVDQGTGVGTLINVGDRVDVLIALTTPKFPLVQVDPVSHLLSPVQPEEYVATSSKLILQNMQVVGTLAPPVATAANGTATPTTEGTLTGQQELVILAVTPQQAEVIKFAQTDASISLVLRSPKDFDNNGQPVTPAPDTTTGIVLKTLIDDFGVLPPTVIEIKGLPTAP